MNAQTADVAGQYLEAWKKKDLDGIEKCVHAEVEFKGPMAELAGRESFLAACKRMFPLLKEIVVRSTFASGSQAMFAYDFICHEPIGVCRTAELVTLEDGLIKRVELFFDARPFERMAKSQTAKN